MLKIKFLSTTTGGLADHEIPKNCRNVLDRLRANPLLHYTNRTGQELVWNVFRALLYTEYRDLQSQVEFYNGEDKVIFNSDLCYSGTDIKLPPSLLETCSHVLLDFKKQTTLADQGF